MISSIPAVFADTCRRLPDKPAVYAGSEHLTFQQLYEGALANAEVLRNLGIKKGDRVGICMNKTIDQVLTILGVMFCDAVFVPILPKLKHANIEHVIVNSGMKALITDSARLREIEGFRDQVKVLLGQGDLIESYSHIPYLRKSVKVERPSFSCIGNDTAAIIYSSGSTGRPKGIVVSHRNLFDGARIVSNYLGTREDDRIAGVLSFNFDYGLNQLWQTLYVGCSLHLHEFVFANDFFKFLHESNITALPLMPAIISKMYDPRFYKPTIDFDFSKIRYVCSSGGRVYEKMIDNLQASFSSADIYLMYGLTEAFRSTYLPPEQLRVRPTSIGRAIPDAEILVMDDQGQECAPDVPGELVHRGGVITKGYWNDPDATAKRFRSIPQYPGETLVFSGDLVRKDAEGYIFFLSRKDAMIKTQGFRVSPTEVEEEANKHKEITASVAFGKESQENGEDIVLVYTSTTGSPLDESLVRNFLVQNLPRYMVPQFFVHLPEFPTTGNEGKIDRLSVQGFALESFQSPRQS